MTKVIYFYKSLPFGLPFQRVLNSGDSKKVGGRHDTSNKKLRAHNFVVWTYSRNEENEEGSKKGRGEQRKGEGAEHASNNVRLWNFKAHCQGVLLPAIPHLWDSSSAPRHQAFKFRGCEVYFLLTPQQKL